MIKRALYNWVLPRLLLNACDSTIPRSGEEGEKVNCFVVAIDHDKAPFFIATKYVKQSLIGLEWDGNSYTKPHSFSLSELENEKLRVTHYYGLSTVTSDNIYDIAWNRFSKFVYLKIHIFNYIISANQYFFNKRKLVTQKRIKLLKFMVNDQLDRTHDGITSMDLMTKLYSIKWVLHPNAGEQEKKLDLYLASLVFSKNLEKINNEYVVGGKALLTIEKHEEEERKHTEAVKLQRKMFWLTVFLAALAIVQAGLINLPTLLDLTPNSNKGIPCNTKIIKK